MLQNQSRTDYDKADDQTGLAMVALQQVGRRLKNEPQKHETGNNSGEIQFIRWQVRASASGAPRTASPPPESRCRIIRSVGTSLMIR